MLLLEVLEYCIPTTNYVLPSHWHQLIFVSQKIQKMSTTPHFTLKYSKEERKAHVADWSVSGLSKKAYCEQHGLVYGTFKGWVRQFDGPPSSRRTQRRASPRTTPGRFVPIVLDGVDQVGSPSRSPSPTSPIVWPIAYMNCCLTIISPKSEDVVARRDKLYHQI